MSDGALEASARLGTVGPAPGRLLAGRYRLVSPIACGGMAEVWEGRDEVLGRAVAVKVLRSHLSGDATFVERFRREAVTAARLSTPGIVATYDTGLDAGTAYIVMELVAGRTLRQLLDGAGPLDVGLATAIAAQIAGALAHAHHAGLVHRDVKPANVLVCDDEVSGVRVKVTDFGIAKARAGIGTDLTQTGTVLGTPKYLSPEQVQGRDDIDQRSDLYSLGVVLFEMLTGRVPFQGSTDMAIALAHLHDTPPRATSLRPGLPLGLDALVARLLAKSPDDRPATAGEVRRALERMTPSPVPGSPGDRTVPGPSAAGPSAAGPSGGRTASGPQNGERRLARETSRPLPEGRIRPRPPVPPPAGEPRLSPRAAPDRSATVGRVRRRRNRGAGLTVAGVVVAAVAVGGALLAGVPGRIGRPAASSGLGQPVGIRAVSVYLDVTGHSPDDPAGTVYAFDGNPATSWWTDQYQGPDKSHFGDLYNGEGLAIRLDRSVGLTRLTVLSSTQGWAARTYVTNHAVASGSPLAAWGRPTATKVDINGTATFGLAGRRGDWVLLWLTDLGPAGRANVAELHVFGAH